MSETTPAPFPGVSRIRDICFGRYRIAGTGAVVSILVDRHRAGDSLELLAEDYRVPVEWVREAIEWWERRRQREADSVWA